MLLMFLRKERDDLIEILSDEFHEDYDAVSSELLEDCCQGNKYRLHAFKDEYCKHPNDDYEQDPGWVSYSHERFFQVCNEIAALEQKTYKEAFV